MGDHDSSGLSGRHFLSFSTSDGGSKNGDQNGIEVISVETMERLEKRFQQLANGPEASTRRTLLAILTRPIDELQGEMESTDGETQEALLTIDEFAVEYVNTLKEFVDVLDVALRRLHYSLHRLRH